MRQGKIVKKFKLGGQRVIFRYPEISDLAKLLDFINVMVAEKAHISNQKKLTLVQEKIWLDNQLRRIKGKEMVNLIVEINDNIMGGADIKKSKALVQRHVGIFGIILRKESRGKGISERLFKALIMEAKKFLKIKILKLEVFSVNKRAIAFYKKMGFQPVGTIKKGLLYYGRFLDEITMVKYL